MALENLKSAFNDLSVNKAVRQVARVQRNTSIDNAVKETENLLLGRTALPNTFLTDLANPTLNKIDYSLRGSVGLPFGNLGDNPPDFVRDAVKESLDAEYPIQNTSDNLISSYLIDKANQVIDSAKVRTTQELVEIANVPVVGKPTPFTDLGGGPRETNYIDRVSLRPVTARQVDDEIAPRKKGDFYVRIKDLRDGKFIYFRGYVTGITENVSPSFTPTNYIGRSEPVYSYERAERDISFNLKVYPANHTEFTLMYDKIEKLTSLAYPQYLPDNDGLTRMKPPFTELYMAHIGTPRVGQFGFIKSISYTVNEQGDWDSLSVRPRLFDIAISYQILSKRPPGLNTDNNSSEKFYGDGR
tara:strand:- start:3979 stop:5049 length:1071 start_codon:yes stop_codon:yes gene_type:complete